jgi:quercetin dioxygenase-like cupin family protein
MMGDVSIIHEHLPPHTRLPQVYHRRTAEFVYCVAGEMTAYLDGRKHLIRAGGVIQIPPGVRHKFVTAGRSCRAVSIFRPTLRVGPDADIHTGA